LALVLALVGVVVIGWAAGFDYDYEEDEEDD